MIAIFTKEKPSNEEGKAPSNNISQDVENEEDKQNSDVGDTDAPEGQDGLISKPAGSGNEESGNYDELFGNGDGTTSEEDEENDENNKNEDSNGTENDGDTDETDKNDEPENLDKYWSPMY